jgi:hypothetical protein
MTLLLAILWASFSWAVEVSEKPSIDSVSITVFFIVVGDTGRGTP